MALFPLPVVRSLEPDPVLPPPLPVALVRRRRERSRAPHGLPGAWGGDPPGLVGRWRLRLETLSGDRTRPGAASRGDRLPARGRAGRAGGRRSRGARALARRRPLESSPYRVEGERRGGRARGGDGRLARSRQAQARG